MCVSWGDEIHPWAGVRDRARGKLRNRDRHEPKIRHEAKSLGRELGSRGLYPTGRSRTEGGIRDTRTKGVSSWMPAELLLVADGTWSAPMGQALSQCLWCRCCPRGLLCAPKASCFCLCLCQHPADAHLVLSMHQGPCWVAGTAMAASQPSCSETSQAPGRKVPLCSPAAFKSPWTQARLKGKATKERNSHVWLSHGWRGSAVLRGALTGARAGEGFSSAWGKQESPQTSPGIPTGLLQPGSEKTTARAQGAALPLALA